MYQSNQQTSEKLEDQQGSGILNSEGQDKIKTNSLPLNSNQYSIQIENYNKSHQVKNNVVKLQVSIEQETPLTSEIINTIENLVFFHEGKIVYLVSSIQANLKNNKDIKDFNILIQANNKEEGTPHLNIQQQELSKEKISQYLDQFNYNSGKRQEDPTILTFLNQKFSDIFPQKQIGKDDFIKITINIVLFKD